MAKARKAASVANAMLNHGVAEGEAIATANARAEGKPRRRSKTVAPALYSEPVKPSGPPKFPPYRRGFTSRSVTGA